MNGPLVIGGTVLIHAGLNVDGGYEPGGGDLAALLGGIIMLLAGLLEGTAW